MFGNLIKRIFALTIISTTFLAAVPMSAHAEWRSIANKWYWREGNSYAKGWKEIDNKRYYFDNNGIMVRNNMIDGYYMDGSGVAVSTTTGDLPIRIPSNWVKVDKENKGKADSYIIDGKAVFVYDAIDASGYSESDFIEGMKDGFKDKSSDIQVFNKTYARKNATCLEYEFTSNHELEKAAIIVIFNNDKAYAFCVASSPEEFDNSKQQVEDMLNFTLVL